MIMISDIKLKPYLDKIKSGSKLKVVPSKEQVPVPGMMLPISADSSNITRVLEDAQISETEVVIIGKKDRFASDISAESFFHFGTVGRVIQILKIPGMGVKAIIQPLKRAIINNFFISNETLMATVDIVEIVEDVDDYVLASFRIIKNLFEEYSSFNKSFSEDYVFSFKNSV